MDKILDIIEVSLLKLEKVHGEIEKSVKYGNCVVVTFKDGKAYKIGLPSLQTTVGTLDDMDEENF